MCLFCEIINGNIPSTKIYEDDMIYAFRDINPVAPVHFLVVPKAHIDNVNAVTAENSKYVARIPTVYSSVSMLRSSLEITFSQSHWST